MQVLCMNLWDNTYVVVSALVIRLGWKEQNIFSGQELSSINQEQMCACLMCRGGGVSVTSGV